MARKLDAVTNTIDFAVPAIVAQGQTAKVRVILYGVGGALTGLNFYVIPPNGQLINMVTSLYAVATGFTFITMFEMGYAFQQQGHYTWILHNTATGDVWVQESISADWATNIDAKVSDTLKLATSISQLRSNIVRGLASGKKGA